MGKPHELLSKTILWVKPFHNRSGYGVRARATLPALHGGGGRIRALAVNEGETGINGCDLKLIEWPETSP
jgi:hypothetical protein